MSPRTRTLTALALTAAAVAWWRRPVRRPQATGTWKPAVPQATRR